MGRRAYCFLDLYFVNLVFNVFTDSGLVLDSKRSVLDVEITPLCWEVVDYYGSNDSSLAQSYAEEVTRRNSGYIDFIVKVCKQVTITDDRVFVLTIVMRNLAHFDFSNNQIRVAP